MPRLVAGSMLSRMGGSLYAVVVASANRWTSATESCCTGVRLTQPPNKQTSERTTTIHFIAAPKGDLQCPARRPKGPKPAECLTSAAPSTRPLWFLTETSPLDQTGAVYQGGGPAHLA